MENKKQIDAAAETIRLFIEQANAAGNFKKLEHLDIARAALNVLVKAAKQDPADIGPE